MDLVFLDYLGYLDFLGCLGYLEDRVDLDVLVDLMDQYHLENL